MNVKFTVNDADTLASLANLNADQILSAWANAIQELAKRHAREKIGGDFGIEISRYIELEINGDSAEIRTDRHNGYIGEHVETGGVIRSRNGKKLAIPTRWNTQKGTFARNRTEPLFVLRSQKSNRAYLFEQPGKGEKLKHPLFVLVDQTKPQKPRPWWPTQAEAEAETARYFKEDF